MSAAGPDGAGRVLVVGGASGIGAACVERCRADGLHPLVADLREPEGRAEDVPFQRVDVRDADAVDRAVAALAGGESISGVVYAAGVGTAAPFQEISLKHWNLVLDVNLSGAFHVVRSTLCHMSEGGSIVLVSSIDSESPVLGLSHYCVSKAGLDALSRSIALELGPRGIRCNVVAPGAVRTPLMVDFFARGDVEREFLEATPLGRIAEPEQIANVVAFLLSPQSDQITGARLVVDGGMSLRDHPPMTDR